jgi:putative nucleotidyltransferase with HDIG domain
MGSPAETGKTALQSSLDEYQDVSKAIERNEPLDLESSTESCKPLVEAINNQQFHGILDSVRGHHNYTCVHSLRVATYRSIFGHAIGVLGDDLLTLSTGGLLHDVGKMVTPQDVLNKNSKLDDDEWVCMKEHVNNSSAVYDRTPGISQGIRIIGEQHHEKLNGTGYPRGLKGSELNELARMSAIVDIFGALND